MSNIDKRALREIAESTIGILENIAGFEPSDVDGDTVELRFETEDGFDTGCDVSIVDQCQKAADIVRALLDEVEAKEEQRANWFQMAQKLGEYLDGAEKRIAELESREVKLRDINDFIADVKEPTLANALSQLAKGVRAADISAIRRAGIRIAAAGKGEA